MQVLAVACYSIQDVIKKPRKVLYDPEEGRSNGLGDENDDNFASNASFDASLVPLESVNITDDENESNLNKDLELIRRLPMFKGQRRLWLMTLLVALMLIMVTALVIGFVLSFMSYTSSMESIETAEIYAIPMVALQCVSSECSTHLGLGLTP